MIDIDISQFATRRILVFGDFMVDEYVIGSVDRISPEAPVPVLRVTERRRKLGGAGNVVDNLRSLGAQVSVLGFAGDDEGGRWLISAMRDVGADPRAFFLLDDLATTVKTRYASRGQQFLRCDEELIVDMRRITEAFRDVDYADLLTDVDAVLISDYAKGAVCADLSQKLIAEAAARSIPVLVDPKGVDYSKYAGATGCTPNMKELAEWAGDPIADEEGEGAAAVAMLSACSLDYVFLTRSEKGISLFGGDGGRNDYPARKREVVDVSGAGDTVACVIALGLASGIGAGPCCELANIAASIACSKFGTATVTASELLEGVRFRADSKLVTLEQASAIVTRWKEAGKRVVFTNGCFDLLHYGHITSFSQARELGDALVVAVNSDASVRRIKGPNRPIISEHDRMGLIAALACVDCVLLMDDDNPVAFISELQPDVIVKGKDWEATGVPEARIVEEYGGAVEYIDMAAGLSTTNIIDRVVARYGDSD